MNYLRGPLDIKSMLATAFANILNIWIKTVCHSDGIPGVRNFREKDFEKKNSRRQQQQQQQHEPKLPSLQRVNCLIKTS